MSGVSDTPLPFSGGRPPTSDTELALVKRRIVLLYLVTPGLSAPALLIGFDRDWPKLAALGAIGLGLTALVIGELAIAERRLMFMARGFRGSARSYLLYEGVAAVPLGAAYLTAGASLIVPAVLFLLGIPLAVLRDHVLARPGYVLIPTGAFLFFHGIGFVIGFADRGRSFGQRAFDALINLPGRLGGLILLVWGAAALAIGLIEWLTPDVFQLGFQRVFGNPWPFPQR